MSEEKKEEVKENTPPIMTSGYLRVGDEAFSDPKESGVITATSTFPGSTFTVVNSPMTKEDNALVKQLHDAIDDEETETNGKSLGVLDILTQKFMSRKMLVFVIATVLLFMGKIDASNWILVASIYISSQAIIEVVAGMKNKE